MITVSGDAREDQEWTSLVTACDGNPLHWRAVTAADYMGSPILTLVFSDADGVAACALAYDRTLYRWRFFRAGRELELPTPPAIATGRDRADGRRAVYEALFAFARDRGFDRLIVQPRFGSPLDDLPHLAPFRKDEVREFVVDLRRDWESIAGDVHRFHRKNIRRAEREGLVVVSDPSIGGLLQLRRLQFSSSRRSAGRGGGFQVRDEAYFARVHAQVYGRGLGEVLFAKLGTEALAGLAFVIAGDKAMTVRSGSSPAGYERNAMYLLQDAALKVAHGRGLREMNLGGVPAAASQAGHAQHGLYEFKRGFGGAERLLHQLVVPLKAGSPPMSP